MIWLLGFIIGICLGSFTKVIADRSLTNKSFWGRSYCESCKHKLTWYDLFPVVSYLIFKGKCSHCHKKFSSEYLLFEILMGLLVSGIFAKVVPANFLELDWISQSFIAISLITYLLIGIVLSATFLTDFKTGYIPDRITYPGIWSLFILLGAASVYKVTLLYISLSSSGLGKYLLPPYSNYFYSNALELSGPFIYGSLMGLMLGLFFYLLIVITRGKGMGGGDLKLGVFLGLAFGFPYSLVVIMLSFLLGSIIGVGLILGGKKKFGQTLAFGPFMSLAGVIVIFWGSEILSWYLNIKIQY
jgi:prepilin signal peptidase PulO-like enzyme (type II secretory pathway)